LLISLFLNIVATEIKSKEIVDSDEILLSAAAATIPCMLFDYLLNAIQKWQQKRSGTVISSGFGAFGRTVISLFLNFALCALLTYIYRTVGHAPQDAFLVGACMWLIVAIPVLFTSRYIDDTQRQLLAGRVLVWLAKTAIAASVAAYFVTFSS